MKENWWKLMLFVYGFFHVKVDPQRLLVSFFTFFWRRKIKIFFSNMFSFFFLFENSRNLISRMEEKKEKTKWNKKVERFNNACVRISLSRTWVKVFWWGKKKHWDLPIRRRNVKMKTKKNPFSINSQEKCRIILFPFTPISAVNLQRLESRWKEKKKNEKQFGNWENWQHFCR